MRLFKRFRKAIREYFIRRNRKRSSAVMSNTCVTGRSSQLSLSSPPNDSVSLPKYLNDQSTIITSADTFQVMRIAVVAPLFETIPPRQYGGTERVVAYLVEQYNLLGHKVTLYAAGGSQTSAQLVECWPRTFREDGIGISVQETQKPYTEQLNLALSALANHDIVHVHHNTYPYHPMVIEAARKVPVVWTDHNAIHNDSKPEILKSLTKLGVGLTAISNSHRNTVPEADWAATVYNGLPRDLLTPTGAKASHLVFLGRISPEKGVTAAIRIAKSAGYPLKIAAKVDVSNRAYYENEVKPHFDGLNVDYIGEISEKEKASFLSPAVALLFPICWPEPFGLVMIEAMACGCPVIAFRQGAVPEIIEDGLTGFVVDTEEEAIEAVKKVDSLDRQIIRKRFEERFTSAVMAERYLQVYKRAIAKAGGVEEVEEVTKPNVLHRAKPNPAGRMKADKDNSNGAVVTTTRFPRTVVPRLSAILGMKSRTATART